MKFSEYKKYTNEEKAIHNFETQQAILCNVKETNGRVSSLEKWRWILTGGIILIGVLFPYLKFIN